MLSESAARDLLVQAGETIDVPPGMPELPPAPPRRWPVLAAAAAVVAVVATTGVFALQRDTDTAPSGDVTIPRVDFGAHTAALEPGQIPSVFGYDEGAARSMLEDLGLVVTVARQETPCSDPGGRAARTEPSVGTPFRTGDPVTLFVTRPVSAPCPANGDLRFAWQLLDFANGRGPAPAFADNVWVAANHESGEIPGEMAADPDTWVDGTPLGVLRQLSNEAYLDRILRISPSDPARECHGLDLSGVPRTGSGLSISISFLQDGLEPCTTVDVFRTHGQITAIALRTDRVPSEIPDPSVVPDVIGMTGDEARRVLEAQGWTVETVPPPGTKMCLRAQPAIVGNQSPLPGTHVDPGSVVTIALRWVSCDESPATETSP